MKANIKKVLELIDELSLEEKKDIYKKMQGDINSKLLELFDKVSERADRDSISLEEITDEVEQVRGQRNG